MRDALGPGSVLGYCTNVHAGVDLPQVRAGLERYAVPIKAAVSPERPMGVGLWLSAAAAAQLSPPGAAEELRGWLERRGLYVFTLNGFPYGDFHRPRVGTRVYRPHWADRRRLDHTLNLARLLAAMLPEWLPEGSISTLPVGWSPAFCGLASTEPGRSRRGRKLTQAADHLMELVHGLARVELDTGRLIHVDLEPEPGCVFERSADVVSFFERYLWGGPDERSVRAYLGVCHDVCHAAVMFEDQAEAIGRYLDAGLRVGKVQLSSALRVDWARMAPAARPTAWRNLGSFAEPRYLHQTTVRDDGGIERRYPDLPAAMEAECPGGQPPDGGSWRVHFHVPVFAESVGGLDTTRDEIVSCLKVLEGAGSEELRCRHFEVETYAWDRLPGSVPAAAGGDTESSSSQEVDGGGVTEGLAAGIARELRWVAEVAKGGTEAAACGAGADGSGGEARR